MVHSVGMQYTIHPVAAMHEILDTVADLVLHPNANWSTLNALARNATGIIAKVAAVRASIPLPARSITEAMSPVQVVAEHFAYINHHRKRVGPISTSPIKHFLQDERSVLVMRGVIDSYQAILPVQCREAPADVRVSIIIEWMQQSTFVFGSAYFNGWGDQEVAWFRTMLSVLLTPMYVPGPLHYVRSLEFPSFARWPLRGHYVKLISDCKGLKHLKLGFEFQCLLYGTGEIFALPAPATFLQQSGLACIFKSDCSLESLILCQGPVPPTRVTGIPKNMYGAWLRGIGKVAKACLHNTRVLLCHQDQWWEAPHPEIPLEELPMVQNTM